MNGRERRESGTTNGTKRKLSSASYIVEAKYTWAKEKSRRTQGDPVNEKERSEQKDKNGQEGTKKKQKEHCSVWRLGLQFSINYAKYSHSQSGIWLESVCLGQRGCSRTVKGRADGKKVKRLCKQNGNKQYFI